MEGRVLPSVCIGQHRKAGAVHENLRWPELIEQILCYGLISSGSALASMSSMLVAVAEAGRARRLPLCHSSSCPFAVVATRSSGSCLSRLNAFSGPDRL